MGKEYPPVELGPWPKGMNNRAAETDLGEGELRETTNLDISTSGRVRRRLGSSQVYAGTSVRSVASTGRHLIFAEGTDLKIGLPGPITLRSDLTPGRRVSYTRFNDTVYYSDGVVQGRIFNDATHVPHWSVAKPSSAPNIVIAAGGAFHPGRYRMRISFRGENGEEGPVSLESFLDINLGEHIQITSLPLVTDPYVTHYLVYLTGPSDDTFYFNVALPVAVGLPYDMFSVQQAFGLMSTKLMEVFPPTEMVEYFAGRMWGVSGKVLLFSEPLRYGLYTPRYNYFMFEDEITVHAPCEDGIYVVADKTYWLVGRDPKGMRPVGIMDKKGVKYSAARIKNSNYVSWFTPYGYVIGTPGGQVKVASEERVAVDSYREGAVLFREQRGIRQLVGNFKTGAATQLIASDNADMEIVRRGE